MSKLTEMIGTTLGATQDIVISVAKQSVRTVNGVGDTLAFTSAMCGTIARSAYQDAAYDFAGIAVEDRTTANRDVNKDTIRDAFEFSDELLALQCR